MELHQSWSFCWSRDFASYHPNGCPLSPWQWRLGFTSSEDLGCFFYLFQVPEAWSRFMGFGREIPRSMIPPGGEGKKCFRTVLPMGYLNFNSVGIAQSIHRAVILRAIRSIKGLGKSVQEIRRDRVFSCCSNLFRVYLDNFDQLQKLGNSICKRPCRW